MSKCDTWCHAERSPEGGMSELRQNIATKEWVIVEPDRLKGKTLQETLNPLQDELPRHDDRCPFCPGNEDRFDNVEIDSLPHPDPTNDAGSRWLAQVLENKYKIFEEDPSQPAGPVEFDSDGFHRHLHGYGSHDLVIESPVHNETFATMATSEVAAVLELYLRRFRALDGAGNLLTVIFKNHGSRSGASQSHPHTQVVGMRVVPNYIRFLLEEARRYFDSHGVCVYCKMLDHELEAQNRIVWANDRFVSFVPFAAGVPYEVMLLSRRHAAHFGGLTGEEIEDFADCLRATMRKLYFGLSNPDYNIVVKNAPYRQGHVPFFHWHVQIAPSLRSPGGFELGARVNVNVVSPEDAAEHLRSVQL